MPTIPVEMTEADFLAGQRAFYRMKLWVKAMVAVSIALLALVALAGAWTAMRRGVDHLWDLLPLALVGLGWLWWSGRLLWGSPGNARRYFHQSQMNRPLEYAWDEAGFTVRGEDLFQRRRWPEILRWADTRDTIALMITDRSYIPVPKRFFSAEDLDDLKARLQAVKT